MGRNIKDLHPRLQEKIQELQSACNARNLKIGISECFRTVIEQDALYAKGRSVPGSIVTNARGSSYSSQHQWGIAVDFYRNDGKGSYDDTGNFFEQVGAIAKSIGLGWGGEWTSPKDLPHLYLTDWGSTPTKLKEQYKTPGAFIQTWKLVSKPVSVPVNKPVSNKIDITYTAHSSDIGWGEKVSGGDTAGVKGKKLEALKIEADKCNISAQVHVQDIGWMPAVSGLGTVTVGTTGKGKAIEAIKITCAEKGVTYRVHTIDGSWGDPIWNSGQAGVTGKAKALDQIQITI